MAAPHSTLERVRNPVRIEPLAIVGDFENDLLRSNVATYLDTKSCVVAVPVL